MEATCLHGPSWPALQLLGPSGLSVTRSVPPLILDALPLSSLVPEIVFLFVCGESLYGLFSPSAEVLRRPLSRQHFCCKDWLRWPHFTPDTGHQTREGQQAGLAESGAQGGVASKGLSKLQTLWCCFARTQVLRTLSGCRTSPLLLAGPWEPQGTGAGSPKEPGGRQQVCTPRGPPLWLLSASPLGSSLAPWSQPPSRLSSSSPLPAPRPSISSSDALVRIQATNWESPSVLAPSCLSLLSSVPLTDLCESWNSGGSETAGTELRDVVLVLPCR